MTVLAFSPSQWWIPNKTVSSIKKNHVLLFCTAVAIDTIFFCGYTMYVYIISEDEQDEFSETTCPSAAGVFMGQGHNVTNLNVTWKALAQQIGLPNINIVSCINRALHTWWKFACGEVSFQVEGASKVQVEKRKTVTPTTTITIPRNYLSCSLAYRKVYQCKIAKNTYIAHYMYFKLGHNYKDVKAFICYYF